jgi:phage-related protein
MPQTTLLVFREGPNEAPFTKWIDALEIEEPKAYARCIERILQLERFGYEMRRPAADILRDSIYELRAKIGRVHYRILYFFCGKNVVCLSHGFTKVGAVPKHEIDAAIRAKKLVDKDRVRYTESW